MKVHNGQQKLNLWNYWSMIEILTQRIFHSKINVIYCYIILHKQCTQYFCSVDKNNTTLQSRSWTVSMRANITHAKRPCCLAVNRCVQLATDVQNWWHEGCWARPDQTDCSRPPSTCTQDINDFIATLGSSVINVTNKLPLLSHRACMSVCLCVCVCVCVCVCGYFLSVWWLPPLIYRARPDQTDCSRPPSTCTKVIHMALSFNDFTATREVLSSTWQTSCHFSVTVYVCLCICVCVCGHFLSVCRLPRLLL